MKEQAWTWKCVASKPDDRSYEALAMAKLHRAERDAHKYDAGQLRSALDKAQDELQRLRQELSEVRNALDSYREDAKHWKSVASKLDESILKHATAIVQICENKVDSER